MKKRSGEISWDEKPTHQIRPGSTRIRILEEPKTFDIHWVKVNESYQKNICDGDGCKLCEKGIRRTPRYHIDVYDYRDQTVKKVEVGAAAYGQISEYIKDPNWGDPIGYDVTIHRERNIRGGSNYRVRAVPPAPLSAEAQNVVDESHGREIPIERLVLDGDNCPKCDVRGALDSSGFKCICPKCQYVIWERSSARW